LINYAVGSVIDFLINVKRDNFSSGLTAFFFELSRYS